MEGGIEEDPDMGEAVPMAFAAIDGDEKGLQISEAVWWFQNFPQKGEKPGWWKVRGGKDLKP